MPIGRIGVSSPGTGLSHIVQPLDWGNPFVYGERIDMLGYLAGRDLAGRKRRKVLKDLHPVADLIRRAREWVGETKTR